VYGKRVKRAGESFLKKITSAMYYRLLKRMANVDIPVDTGDFRLMDRKVVDALNSMPERSRYIRGMVSWVGFRQTGVEFEREARFAGATKYNARKLISLAFNGIAAFSNKPLKLATAVGMFFSMLSAFFIVFIIVRWFVVPGSSIEGWASMVAILLFTQGVMLVMQGMIGEYIGRVYEETKARPNYIVSDFVNIERKVKK
jgi:dolichol-phosphate mannosyltransferase